MSTYRATAHREDAYWVVRIEGVGVTQGRNLAEAKVMAADLVVAMLDVEPAQVTVELDVDLPHGLGEAVTAARHSIAEAASAQRRAAEQSRALVRALRGDAGMTGKDIAAVLGVSEQRVSQLAAGSPVRSGEVHSRRDPEALATVASPLAPRAPVDSD